MIFSFFSKKDKVLSKSKSISKKQLDNFLEDLKLPLSIKERSLYDIYLIKTDTLKAFESLDYGKDSLFELVSKKEWDSYSIGIAIYILQNEKKAMFIDDKIDDYFSEDIQNMKEQTLYNFLYDILNKFRDITDKTRKKETLENKIEWNALDIILIYYYLYLKSK